MTFTRDAPTTIFEPGTNCWKIVRSDRTALLIDGAAYFANLRKALAAARHSVLIVGWDINTLTPLTFGPGKDAPREDQLGHILRRLVAERPELNIHILDWKAPPLYGRDRQGLLSLRLGWMSPQRIHFTFDDAHPVGASHHQKVVVIDDALAFVGGLDLTLGRNDTPEHLADDPRRTNPDGSTYGPFHDVMVAVSGEAAAALGELARQRWAWATSRVIDPPPDRPDAVWPDGLAPDFTDHDVAIARTLPAWQKRPEIYEIEALYLAEIEAARSLIYIENQYFTSNRIAEALGAVLQKPEGPDVVVVMPRDPTGWLEKTSMVRRREMLLGQLREQDRFDRLRVYHPVVGADQSCAVKVHTKLMIVDGRALHVGSANLNNRSMGLDSECNVAWLYPADSDGAERIAAIQVRLLGEHLGHSERDVAAAVREHGGSLIAAIEALRGAGRTLVPYAPTPTDVTLPTAIDKELFDPAEPSKFERLSDWLIWERGNGRRFRNRLIGLIVTVVVLSILAVAWRWGPLAGVADVADLGPLSQIFQSPLLNFIIGLAAFIVAALLMVPVVVLIFAAGFVYGPIAGFALAFAGAMLATALGYLLGGALGKPVLDRFAGSRVDALSQTLGRRGIITSVIVRLLPIAPFAFVNMAAGASHIGFRDFMAGSALGMLPGTVALTLISSQLERTTTSADLTNIALLLAILAAVGLIILWVWRRFVRPADI